MNSSSAPSKHVLLSNRLEKGALVDLDTLHQYSDRHLVDYQVITIRGAERQGRNTSHFICEGKGYSLPNINGDVEERLIVTGNTELQTLTVYICENFIQVCKQDLQRYLCQVNQQILRRINYYWRIVDRRDAKLKLGRL